MSDPPLAPDGPTADQPVLLRHINLPFGHAATGAPAPTSTSTPAHAAAASSAARGSLILLSAALGCRAVALDCGFSPNWPTVANVHVFGRAASRECGKPKKSGDYVAIPF
jgi:hypothetical protein